MLALPAGHAAAVLKAAESAGISARTLGRTGGRELTVAGHGAISLAALQDAHEGWLPRYMAGEL